MTRLNKVFVLTGLLALVVSSLVAGGINQSINSNQNYSTSVNVPSTASCYQSGASYHNAYWVWDGYQWVDMGWDGVMTNNGPLGNYARSPGNPLSVSGSIGAGTYSIYLETYGSGYAHVDITW